jgi:hypothetical protein
MRRLVACEWSTGKSAQAISPAGFALNHHALRRERLRRPDWAKFTSISIRVEMLALGVGFTLSLSTTRKLTHGASKSVRSLRTSWLAFTNRTAGRPAQSAHGRRRVGSETTRSSQRSRSAPHPRRSTIAALVGQLIRPVRKAPRLSQIDQVLLSLLCGGRKLGMLLEQHVEFVLVEHNKGAI